MTRGPGCNRTTFVVSVRLFRTKLRALSFCTRVFSQSKIKPIGKAVLNLPPKLLKIRYALVVPLSPKGHLPLRAVALIFVGNFLNANRFGSCGGRRQSRHSVGKEEHNECRQCCPQC